ncbi:universal stress protein [Oceanicaulis sp.]|uniref:universal stress protein n=1 Tax=Oceanicaulis sp. TaxID=1924941 RepID=UPI003BA8A2DA
MSVEQAPLDGPVLAVCRADGLDDALLERAAHAARSMDAPLIAVAVEQPPADIKAMEKATGLSREAIAARLEDELKHRLNEACQRVSLDWPVRVVTRLGKPFLEIIRIAIKEQARLVLKTAEDLAGPRGVFFASTDQHLLRKCPSPVWLIREDADQKPQTLLAAVDVDPLTAEQPETESALNMRIVETAARIAALSGARLHILHVWEAAGEGVVRMWSNEAGGVDHYLDEIRDHHSAALERFMLDARRRLADLGLSQVQMKTRLKRGDPRQIIPEDVQAMQADMLVMGTIARTGVPGFIIGNTAEDVLNSVECSVVTVKPPGYVSPVK